VHASEGALKECGGLLTQECRDLDMDGELKDMFWNKDVVADGVAVKKNPWCIDEEYSRGYTRLFIDGVHNAADYSIKGRATFLKKGSATENRTPSPQPSTKHQGSHYPRILITEAGSMSILMLVDATCLHTVGDVYIYIYI